MTDTTNNDEPTRDAPLVSVAARSNGKASALVDQVLGRADERGIRVQVVKSNTPTREQIEQAAEQQYPALNPDAEELSYPRSAIRDMTRGAFRSGAEYVLALLSQPSPSTPSAEDYGEHEYEGNTFIHTEPGQHPTPEPPRIEDMAPGTKADVAQQLDYLAEYISPAPDAALLTAGANEIHALRRKVATLTAQLSSAIAVDEAEMRTLNNRLERVADWREQCFAKPSAVLDLLDRILRDEDIDPSTVRDVTPPPALPEDGR